MLTDQSPPGYIFENINCSPFTVQLPYKKRALRQYAPLLVATIGLPGRGKSLLAHRLSRYLNFIGETTKSKFALFLPNLFSIYTFSQIAVLDISEYRRKHVTKYSSHEMFRADNLPAYRIRQQSFREALEDSAKWLKEPGHSVAILDGPNVSRSQRQEIYDLISGELGFRVMFIECVCENPSILEQNFKDILKYSVDYRDMAAKDALTDLTYKMAHYKAQYESPTLGSELELPCPTVKLLEGGYGGLVAHGINGVKECKILSYISVPKPTQQVLYFSRVSLNKV